jgi:hypothetical protein
MDVPDRPFAAVLHDEDRVLLLGGRAPVRDDGRETWIFEGGQWRRGPPLPYGMSHPHAWLAGPTVFLAGTVELDCKLLELSRELELVREHTFRWPLPSMLHVDRRGQVWGLVERDPGLPGALEIAMILASPCSYPSMHELRDGTLLVWATGGADHGEPRGTRLWRLVGEGEPRWEQLAVVPTGVQGLGSQSLELESGEVLLLTIRGELVRFDPRSGKVELVASLDADKSMAFWAGGCLLDAGEGQVVAIRPAEARRVDLATGEVQQLRPPAHPRVRAEGVWDPQGRLWLVAGFSPSKQGLPPELFPLVPLENPRKRRPRGVQVIFPEGPPLVPAVGEQVHLKSGPYARMVGTVTESGSDQLLVEVSLFGRLLSVRIALSETESL